MIKHYHIKADGFEEHITTDEKKAYQVYNGYVAAIRDNFDRPVEIASQTDHATIFTDWRMATIRECKSGCVEDLFYNPEEEERKRQEELKNLPVDPSEEMRKKYNLDGGA